MDECPERGTANLAPPRQRRPRCVDSTMRFFAETSLLGIDPCAAATDGVKFRSVHRDLASRVMTRQPWRVTSRNHKGQASRVRDRVRRPLPSVDRSAGVTWVSHVRAELDEDLGEAEEVGVDVEADCGQPTVPGHAAAAEFSYASAHRTSRRSAQTLRRISAVSSPGSSCSARTLVEISRTRGRPNRTSGSIRTGYWGHRAGASRGDAVGPGDSGDEQLRRRNQDRLATRSSYEAEVGVEPCRLLRLLDQPPAADERLLVRQR